MPTVFEYRRDMIHLSPRLMRNVPDREGGELKRLTNGGVGNALESVMKPLIQARASFRVSRYGFFLDASACCSFSPRSPSALPASPEYFCQSSS